MFVHLPTDIEAEAPEPHTANLSLSVNSNVKTEETEVG